MYFFGLYRTICFSVAIYRQNILYALLFSYNFFMNYIDQPTKVLSLPYLKICYNDEY